ncbi:MAG: hypothetical protein JWP91_1087 [Fibrobacteres bacterium]|nr:hypothetical protein [Fibrobacterota bacterium]
MNAVWRLPAFLALLAFACLTGCLGEGRLAGGGGVDVEGITVEGTAMRADRTPVMAAQVRLRAWDFQKPSGAPKIAIDHGDTRTDSLGRFRFADVDSGRYALEVDAGPEGAIVLEIEADGTQRVLVLEAQVRPTGTLAGAVRDTGRRAVADALVGILGLDRETRTDSSGAFLLSGLPPGRYTVRVSPPSPLWSSIELPQIDIRGAEETRLDSLVLPNSIPGILAQWRFDEGKGPVAGNTQGSEARAILSGGASWAPARDSLGISLPGTGLDFAFVPRTKSASLDRGTDEDFTVTAWIRIASPKARAGSARHIADSRTGYAPNGYSLGLAADGGAEFLFQAIGEKDPARIAGGSDLDDGAWHLLAAGRAGARFFLFADGALLGETTGPTAAITKDNPLYFGGHEGKSDFFPGLIDDVRLYSRGLTADEEKSQFLQPAP